MKAWNKLKLNIIWQWNKPGQPKSIYESTVPSWENNITDILNCQEDKCSSNFSHLAVSSLAWDRGSVSVLTPLLAVLVYSTAQLWVFTQNNTAHLNGPLSSWSVFMSFQETCSTKKYYVRVRSSGWRKKCMRDLSTWLWSEESTRRLSTRSQSHSPQTKHTYQHCHSFKAS